MDKIDGGSGNDRLKGGHDDDVIFGNEGKDHIDGDGGDDTLHGGLDADKVHGKKGNDKLVGGVGGDELKGDDGDDTLFSQDDIVLTADDGLIDYLQGGKGDLDTCYVGVGDFWKDCEFVFLNGVISTNLGPADNKPPKGFVGDWK